MKTILIATDGSEPAGQALDVAIDIAKQTGATLQVLSVRPPIVAGRARSRPADPRGRGARRAPSTSPRPAAAHAREAGVDATAHVAHGDVVDSIADAATAFGADMLVVGSRGHGPLSGAVLGSVSHALVRRSPVPVTIVRHAVAHAA